MTYRHVAEARRIVLRLREHECLLEEWARFVVADAYQHLEWGWAVPDNLLEDLRTVAWVYL